MPETIPITGCADFIGNNLVHRWHRNHPEGRVHVLDKLTCATDPKQIEGPDGVEVVAGDIQNLETARHLIDKSKATKVFHLPSESHADRSITRPAGFIHIYVVGTFSMGEAARQALAGHQDGRFQVISTDEIFDSLSDTDKFHEEMAYAPNGAIKAGSDHPVRAYHYPCGLNIVTTNCSNNYRSEQHPKKLIPLAIALMAQGDPIPVSGDGKNNEGHCVALQTAMLKGVQGETYCVGGGNTRTKLALLNLYSYKVDTQARRPQGTNSKLKSFVQDRVGHDRRYMKLAEETRIELGGQAQTTFGEGLEQTVAWYLGGRLE